MLLQKLPNLSLLLQDIHYIFTKKNVIMYLHRKMYTFLKEYLQPCSFFSILRIALFIPHCPQNKKACSVN